MRTTDWLIGERERLLVVNDPRNLADLLRRRYPQFDVATAPTYLSGVAALAGAPARALLVGVDPTSRKLPQVVSGLRKAAGPDSRVILCCEPSGEPVAREALAAGADDYIIYPPTAADLDDAIALPRLEEQPPEAEVMPTWEELSGLAGVLSGMGGSRRQMLDQLCRIVSQALRTSYVSIVVDDTSAHVGNPETEPSIVETISAGGRTLGKIFVGPRQRAPFTAGEIEKLRHYARLIAHLLDAAERQQHWQSLAMIDELTGLPNRRYLMQALEGILARAAVERFRVTVLVFDVDGFKQFNDTYGHAAGDQIIRDTGQLFRRHCRQHDIVARYAGDEFVVVFWDAEGPRTPGSKHPTDALAVLRRFKKSLESHEFPSLGPNATGKITISGGLASYPWDAKDAASLIERADHAMLQAKRAGKNCIYLVGGDASSRVEFDAPQTS